MSTATSSKQTMRGGPRLICSPYFVGAILIMLGFVSVKYWSISGENSDLYVQLEILQSQLKSSASNVKILDDNMINKQRALKECEKNNEVLMKANDNVREEKESAFAELIQVKQVKQTLKNDIVELKRREALCVKDLDAIRLEMERGTNDALGNKEREIGDLKRRIQELENELTGYKAQLLNMPMHLPREHGDLKEGELGKGQLPDVNPHAVQIEEKPVVDGLKTEDPTKTAPEEKADLDENNAEEMKPDEEGKDNIKMEDDKEDDLEKKGSAKRSEVRVVTEKAIPKKDDTLNEIKKSLNLDAGEADDNNAIPLPNEDEDDQDPNGAKPADVEAKNEKKSPVDAVVDKPVRNLEEKLSQDDKDGIDKMAKNLEVQDKDQGNLL